MASARKKAPKTDTQALFIKRVEEELKRLQISRNELSRRVGAPSQSTLNEILNGAEARLTQIHKIATALGVQVWELFKERQAVGESRQPGNNVRKLPDFPPIIGQQAKPPVIKAHDRKKSRS